MTHAKRPVKSLVQVSYKDINATYRIDVSTRDRFWALVETCNFLGWGVGFLDPDETQIWIEARDTLHRNSMFLQLTEQLRRQA